MSALPDRKSILSLIRFRNLVIGSATVLTGSYVAIQTTWNSELIFNELDKQNFKVFYRPNMALEAMINLK